MYSRPQDPRGPPANCGTHRVSCRYCIHSSSDRRSERSCAHGALKCTVLLEFNTFQSQLTLLFYTACLFSYFRCPWAVCLVQYLLVVLFFFFCRKRFSINGWFVKAFTQSSSRGRRGTFTSRSFQTHSIRWKEKNKTTSPTDYHWLKMTSSSAFA